MVPGISALGPYHLRDRAHTALLCIQVEVEALDGHFAAVPTREVHLAKATGTQQTHDLEQQESDRVSVAVRWLQRTCDLQASSLWMRKESNACKRAVSAVYVTSWSLLRRPHTAKLHTTKTCRCCMTADTSVLVAWTCLLH